MLRDHHISQSKLFLQEHSRCRKVVLEASTTSSMKKRSGLELLRRKRMNLKNIDRLLRLAKRQLLKNMDGRESQRLFMKLLMKENMSTSLLTKEDTNCLKESSAGTTLTKKESNTTLASNQRENGLEKAPENSSQSLMKEKLLSKKK